MQVKFTKNSAEAGLCDEYSSTAASSKVWALAIP